MIPGEYFIPKGEVEANFGRRTETLIVVNTGDRPVHIDSHFHFFEVNPLMAFDRDKAFGMRLNIPAGTAVRFEPGKEKKITLVELAGNKQAFGMNNLVNGSTAGPEQKQQRLTKAHQGNFKTKGL
ncbi:urease subunit beta [Adhaeribacter radiodurans]|uniref:Urease subunit beta n=1 Tax=Adhaeribacter radiodurans TaxID=2745197 RepID=A0A7L7L9R7_9BACT|nr:urease subunit beta [Adhaeribacter radiodurans]QMU29570.1 urease subunit beta [Adhaeribacter radiodurans]